MPDLHTYHGNCHCGAFRFAVQLPELKDVHACNCSICVRARRPFLFPFALRGMITRGKRAFGFVDDG